ncbi:kinase/pyrophosphorylase [Fulvivirga sp. M361]|uniref:pyruvate, water dikinase regulatory protein n=1 Tax=Fulvivirga sp. M361 TaxID=2594266 RepID=UPI00117BAA41|nr:pyruvate, water dikinase regulatory protein [Fulvivirga sp. M361]TRX51906.1 kinase/pyrophosphorylase [Fulvivirga sp. M361]
MTKVKIYVVSDSLSFLAPESIIRIAASYFEGNDFEMVKIPNVKTAQKAIEIVSTAKEHPSSLIIFSTILAEIRDVFMMKCLECNIECIDVLSPAIKSLGKVLKIPPVYQPSHSWQLNDEYFSRIHAIEFAINNDDGQSLSALQKADIILIGVSRTSKTPLSIYLAYHNLLVINIPLVSEAAFPKHLYEMSSKKIIGLTIDPTRLNEIRNERNTTMGVSEDFNYSDLNNIITELEFADQVMKKIGCPVINISNKAVEETAEIIIKLINAKTIYKT